MHMNRCEENKGNEWGMLAGITRSSTIYCLHKLTRVHMAEKREEDGTLETRNFYGLGIEWGFQSTCDQGNAWSDAEKNAIVMGTNHWNETAFV